jgi:LPS export ABC transporter protein LptC
VTVRTTVAGVAVGTAALGACKSPPVPAVAATATLPDSAEQVMFKLRHLVTNAGVRRAQLVGDTAYFYDDGNRVELRVVRIVFFGATGDSSSVLSGRTGRYDVRQKRVEGRGNVVVTSVDGKRLSSPHLVYDQFTNQITSDTNFTFTEPGRTLTGVGLRTDPQLRNVQVLGQLGGRTQVKAGALARPVTPAPPAVSAPAAPSQSAVPAPQAPAPAAGAAETPAPAAAAAPPGARP